MNLFEERGNDGNGGPNLKDPLQVPDGPITRSRAKKIKEAMQGFKQDPNIQVGLERRRTNFNPCGLVDSLLDLWAYFYISMVVGIWAFLIH
jgi:hypothetical protein